MASIQIWSRLVQIYHCPYMYSPGESFPGTVSFNDTPIPMTIRIQFRATKGGFNKIFIYINDENNTYDKHDINDKHKDNTNDDCDVNDSNNYLIVMMMLPPLLLLLLMMMTMTMTMTTMTMMMTMMMIMIMIQHIIHATLQTR